LHGALSLQRQLAEKKYFIDVIILSMFIKISAADSYEDSLNFY